MNAKNPIFIGVAWPYVNGDMHIGHYLGCLLPADITARYFRQQQHPVLMVSGSDCYGTPITIEADKRKIPSRQLVQEYHPRWLQAYEALGSSYDLYTMTMTPIHHKLTQDIFVAMANAGVISVHSSNQYYSEGEKRFLPDRYVEGTCAKCGAAGARSDQCDACGASLGEGDLINPISKNTGTPVALRETEHYFVEWQKLQPWLEQYVAQQQGTWRAWVVAETKKWLTEGLQPRAITRDLDWGIEIPTDRLPEQLRIKDAASKRIYVWFDAVIGYLSASQEWATLEQGRSWELFWRNPAARHYYFMGKDNLVFHTLFWPGQLHVYDPSLCTPHVPAINQFVTLDGQKFSKSKGVTLDPVELMQRYNRDAVRFYSTLISPETSDSDFSIADFVQKTNAILVSNIGNFINRTLKQAEGIPLQGSIIDPRAEQLCIDAEQQARVAMEAGSTRRYLEATIQLSSDANKLITELAPWKIKDKTTVEFKNAIASCVRLVIALGRLLAPVTIDAIPELERSLGASLASLSEKQDGAWLSQVQVSAPAGLFKRLELL